MGYYAYRYGNFSAKFARLNVSEDTIYESDGITQVGVRYNFVINGWITSPTVAGFQQNLICAQSQLHTPRLALIIQWSPDGIAWTDLYNLSSANDIDYGPKPGTLNITQFSGGLAGLYSWSVTATAKTCYTNCSPFSPPSSVLSITRRWSYSIDQNGMTTRTLSGKLTVTSQSVQNGFPADAFRAQIYPPVPSFFQPVSSNFDCSENGREMTFSVVDRELRWTLPIPISGGRASIVIRTLPGLMQHVSLSGRYEAPISVTKAQIYDQICILVQARIPNNVAALTPIFETRTITEDIYNNALDFHFDFQMGCQQGATPTDALSANSGWPFGQQPPGSDGTAQAIGEYGADGVNATSGVNTPTTPIYDACTSNINPSGGGGGGTSGGQPTNTPTPNNNSPGGNYGGPGSSGAQSNQVPVVVNNLSAAHAVTPWLSYHEEYSYEIDTGVRFFPSKVSGVAPLRQQVKDPLITVTQAGYQVQCCVNSVAANPIPAPIYGRDSVTHSSPQYASPEPLTESNMVKYTSRWCYVMVYAGAAPSNIADLNMQYPNDPRTLAPIGGPTTNVPEMISSPA